MRHRINMRINGQQRGLVLDDCRTTLLDLLRERLAFTGTKKGSDREQCGACTVLMDGHRVNACMTFALSCDGGDILTIEGLSSRPALRAAVRILHARTDHELSAAAARAALAGALPLGANGFKIQLARRVVARVLREAPRGTPARFPALPASAVNLAGELRQ